ncbi:MAG: hypothetical protein F2681_04690 [Actinobacteria bacterium]|uniref:Unannotated protein n=1 Tax=freshwater metagenome TaxID=449393 RepID=A0A6J7HFK5_9ZZZZ|nr:hypothetical protein [Actinomycetota bacterium]MSW76533.1 hypothetical protein [Actinomycetota bacterium]MSX56536.1 hypothetical protein [Actinomycetota bacterium]MSZ82421.1 hypothetical protein [Actinomycetota bacterium]MTB16400.1 hypothetical protein [Actinomycetota bacterium]
MKRNQILTAAAILAVGVSGAVAVAANVGIMNAADSNSVGNVTSATDLLTNNTQVVDVYLGSDSVPGGGQQFTVDIAGAVTVSSSTSKIRLDQVEPTTGWTWSLSQSQADTLMVSFTNGTRTIEFTATADANGTITASVNEPTIVLPPANQPSNNGGHDDDEYEGGGDDD